MNDQLLKTIIKNKKTCYFISPHFDDAVLSSGALMTYLSEYVPIVVVNIFTHAGTQPYTFSAKQYLRQCGYTDAQKLFDDRRREDSAVLQKLGATVINLDYIDALWRKKRNGLRAFRKIAELQAMYPTYRLHVTKGKIVSEDEETLEQIKEDLAKIVKKNNAVVFCPLGMGTHIDHIITRIVCEQMFSSLIYWSDFPYNSTTQAMQHMQKAFTIGKHMEEKKHLVEGYKTQYKAMFGNGLRLEPETFFMKEGNNG